MNAEIVTPATKKEVEMRAALGRRYCCISTTTGALPKQALCTATACHVIEFEQTRGGLLLATRHEARLACAEEREMA